MKVLLILINIGTNVTYHQGTSVLYSFLRAKGINIKFIEVTSVCNKLYKDIADINPDVIGISINTHMVDYAKEITSTLRKKINLYCLLEEYILHLILIV